MDDNLILVILTVVIFVVGIIAVFAKYYIRRMGKEQGVDTQDMESGIDSAKDVAINELQQQKNNVKSKGDRKDGTIREKE